MINELKFRNKELYSKNLFNSEENGKLTNQIKDTMEQL